MNIGEACEILGIPEFADRIWNSNSRGELIHVCWYMEIAKRRQAEPEKDWSWFRDVFLIAVDFAEKNWKRPESCFQHMDKLMPGIIEQLAKS